MLTRRIDSELLRNVVAVIERTSQSGGNLAQILEATADEFREANKLQKELYTATKGYVYFIGFLVLIGVPLLLGVASIFIGLTTSQSGGFISSITSVPSEISFIPTPSAGAVCNIDAIFLGLIIFSAISAALMFGVLWQGEVRHGVGYIPILLTISVLSYFFLREAVQTLLKSFGIF
jgi:archaellum biogenesis protein FlaJ (TadC family)